MEQVTVASLPSTIRDHLEHFARRGAVYLVSATTGVVVSAPEERKEGLVIDITTGTIVRRFERAELSPFGMGDWRALVARQEQDVITLQPGQVLVVKKAGRSGSSATVYASRETQLEYFDMANFRAPLSWEELHALALMGYKAFYRKEAIERLLQTGVDVMPAFDTLVAKGFIKRSKSGALTLTPAGIARKSERDVWAIHL